MKPGAVRPARASEIPPGGGLEGERVSDPDFGVLYCAFFEFQNVPGPVSGDMCAERPQVLFEFDDLFLKVKKHDIDGVKHEKHVQPNLFRPGKLKNEVPGLGEHQADGLRQAAREAVGSRGGDPAMAKDIRHEEIFIPDDMIEARPARSRGGRKSA